jgi:hypothetical protein
MFVLSSTMVHGWKEGLNLCVMYVNISHCYRVPKMYDNLTHFHIYRVTVVLWPREHITYQSELEPYSVLSYEGSQYMYGNLF